MRTTPFLAALAVLFVFCSARGQSPTATTLDVPFEVFTLDPAQCQVFAYYSGSQFLIEPGSFVTQRGAPVTGPVTVKYRELHGPAEIIAAGLSMKAEVSGRRVHLETAGMFEIRAEQGGQPLQLAPGKRIRVRMASRIPDAPDLAVYRYADGIWQPTGSAFKTRDQDPSAQQAASPEVWDEGAEYSDTPQSGFDDFGGDDFGFGEGYDPNYVAYQTQVFRDLEIDQMGLYNYDVIYNEANAQRIAASFTVGGKPLVGAEVFVVYRGRNSVFSFPDYDWKDRFYLLADESATLFAIERKTQKLFVFPEGQWASLNVLALRGKAHAFELQPLADAITSPAQLRTLVGIN